MGGKPSKGTRADRRLKENQGQGGRSQEVSNPTAPMLGQMPHPVDEMRKHMAQMPGQHPRLGPMMGKLDRKG